MLLLARLIPFDNLRETVHQPRCALSWEEIRGRECQVKHHRGFAKLVGIGYQRQIANSIDWSAKNLDESRVFTSRKPGNYNSRHDRYRLRYKIQEEQ